MANKRAAKRKRAKERKRILRKQQNAIKEKLQKQGQNSEPDDADLDYVVEMPSAMKDNETYKQIFEKLDPTKQNRSSEDDKNYPVETVAEGAAERLKAQAELSEEDSDSEDEEEKARLSNKKRKLRDRLTIAQLKQVVDRPDLVELHDPNSPDPTLLVLLKSARNSVPVPAHWCDKRRYLAGKRGVQKVVFQLPKAILDTGISDLRNPGKLATLKQKQRQRMNPKIGRLDVDYQKLHAAFFRNMVKPRMTSHGDIYYLGKENEVRYRKHRPGALSKRLRNALHMMENAPPPYLINMQRFGPPPSYPQLRIPGLNAPIPPGCKYGYGDCQWGKPPVNESGYPLYGDPFGVNSTYEQEEANTTEAFLWGEVEENVNYEDEFDEEEENQFGEEEDALGENEEVEPAGDAAESKENDVSPKTDRSTIEDKEDAETAVVYEDRADKTPKQLYKVLDKKDNAVAEKAIMGSAHTYDIRADEKSNKKPNSAESVSVALNEEELSNLDEMTIKLKYENEMKQKESLADKSDLRLAREAVQQKKARKKKDEVAGFKF